MSAEVFLILARAQNGVIGNEGQLPWHLPADLKHFKALTMGKPMVMGRKTFDSFPAPLPGRRHIVLTRDRGWQAHGAEVAHSPREALELAGDTSVAVIGGAEIYAQFLPIADWIELTEVHRDYAGDTAIPPFGPEWQEVSRESFPADENGRPAYSFVTLKRRL